MTRRLPKIACAILTACVTFPLSALADAESADPRGETDTSLEVYAIEDGFELEAAPEVCYGYSGGLSVAGSTARNRLNQIKGIADSWMKFDPAQAVAQFDTVYGVGNWMITNVELRLFEFPTPNHPIFGKGAGRFDIKWLSNDDWSQGSGTPQVPDPATGNIIGFTYGRSLLTSGTVEQLGTFENTMTSGYHSYDLDLTPGFTADMMSVGPVTLYFVAFDTFTGFTFYSSTHSDAPIMIVTADVAPADVCRADINADGLIRGDDIQLYVDAYLDAGNLTPAEFDRIDMNDSDLLDLADIACFVEALLVTHDCGVNGPFVCP